MKYLGSLRKISFDPATLRVYRAALSGYHQWRGEELKFRVKVPETSAKYVPWEIIQKMLDFALGKPHDELILRLMTDAGLRRDEVVSLKLSGIEGNHLRFRGKGGKERMVPMTNELRILVDQFSVGRTRNESLVGLGEKGIYLMVKRYGTLAGMPEITPHDLRRAFGTHLNNVTGNIRIVQQILGHSNVNTTQAYTAVTLNNMEEAIKRLNESEAGPKKKGDSDTSELNIGITKSHALEACLTINTAPPPWNFKHPNPETMFCKKISAGIESSEIEITSVEVVNSDASVAYDLLFFVDAPPRDILEWDTDKIWASGKVNSRFETFKFKDGLNYKDFSKTNTIHGGLKIGHRPLRVDLPFCETDRKACEYYLKPVELKILVRYCPLK
jgi:hypothetical protein